MVYDVWCTVYPVSCAGFQPAMVIMPAETLSLACFSIHKRGGRETPRHRPLSHHEILQRNPTAAKRLTAVMSIVRLLHQAAWTNIYLRGCRGEWCLTGGWRPGLTQVTRGLLLSLERNCSAAVESSSPRRSSIASRRRLAWDHNNKTDRSSVHASVALKTFYCRLPVGPTYPS